MAYLSFLSIFLFIFPSFGQDRGMMSLSPPSSTTLIYGGTWSPEANSPETTQHRFNVATPIIKNEKENLSLSLNTAFLNFGERVVLSKSNTLVPANFYRTEIGGQYTRNLPGERNWGLRGSFGYATDKPFTNSKDMTFNFTTSYSYPNAAGNRWVLFVFMANNSSLPNYVPIPGFIYIYKSEKLTGLFGLPLVSIQWTPTAVWFTNFSLFGPTINAETGYKLTDQTQLFTGFNWNQQTYLRADRVQLKERLFLDEKRIFVGYRSPFMRAFISEVQVGQSFDRSVYEGTGFLKKQGGSADLKNSWTLLWNFRYSF